VFFIDVAVCPDRAHGWCSLPPDIEKLSEG
jgi:hypothetical protein